MILASLYLVTAYFSGYLFHFFLHSIKSFPCTRTVVTRESAFANSILGKFLKSDAIRFFCVCSGLGKSQKLIIFNTPLFDQHMIRGMQRRGMYLVQFLE